MGEMKLSHALLDTGFFCALGTTESHGGGVSFVRRGEAKTWDSNNGILVVYDEAGRPWITTHSKLNKLDGDVEELVRLHDLNRGAPVPHSNDGGYFVRHVLPTL
jgi:hypothetical protein